MPQKEITDEFEGLVPGMVISEVVNAKLLKRVIYSRRTISGSGIESWVDELVRYLGRGMGTVSPLVYLFAPNHVKTVVAYLAIIRLGRTVVLVDPHVGRLELAEMVESAPPAAVIRVDKRRMEFDYESEIAFPKRLRECSSSCDVSGVCTMAFTAATDGYAKAAMLTGENLLTDADALARVFVKHLGGDVISCALLPIHSLFGLQCTILLPMMLPSASICIADLGEDLGQLISCVDTIAEYRVRLLFSVPGVYHLMTLALDIQDQLKNMDVISGGCRLPPDILQEFQQKFDKPIREGYGLTEASPVCTYSHVHRIGSVGRALDCCHVRITDDQGREAPRGCEGNVCVKGTNVMKGYYNDSAATANVLKDGWLDTGDLGRMDEEGYLYITGVKKRMLNVSGRKIYPAEVERLIGMHHNVETVEVRRRPSKVCGDGMWALVRLKERTPAAEEAFKRWCLENISRHKVPQRLQFV